MADVRKELSFCKKTGLKVLGVVENMSGLTVSHGQEKRSCTPRGMIVSHAPLSPDQVRNVRILFGLPFGPTFQKLYFAGGRLRTVLVVEAVL